MRKKKQSWWKQKWAFLFLILIVGFAAYFRLAQINEKSLWLDEGITYYNSSGNDLNEVWEKAATLDQSPPGFYFLMHVYLKIFGENEFGFRLIPIIFSLMMIVFSFLLLKRMFNEAAGLFTAFLLAINPFHIGFSIEARMYMLLALEAVMGLYFLYAAMTEESRWKYLHWAFFMASCVAGVYTHNFFAFALASFGVIYFLLFLFGKNKLEKFSLGILSALVVADLYFPWFTYAMDQYQVKRYWIAPNSISDIYNYLLDFTNVNGYLFVLTLILSFFGIIAVFFSYASKNYKNQILALLSLIIFLVLAMGIPLTYSIYSEPILKIRYMVYLLPPLMGLCALGLYGLFKIHWGLSLAACVAILFLNSPWIITRYPVEMFEDYRGFTNLVKENPAPVIVHTPSQSHVINFYNHGDFSVFPFPNIFDLSEYNIDETFKRPFQKMIENLDKFYLVISHSHENPYGLLEVWSARKCRDKEEIPIEGMRVFYFSSCT